MLWQLRLRLAQMWYKEDGKQPSEIAALLHRNKSTITRRLVKKLPLKKQGRKKLLSESQVLALKKKLDQMVKKADKKYEVTVGMLKKATRTKASVTTIQEALHKKGVYFRPFREKPDLTQDDVKDRRAFAKQCQSKSAAWWNSYVHLHIDVKHFRVYLNGKARVHAAREGARGVYREKSQGLGTPYTKPPGKLKYNTGARGVKVLAGVGGGRVLVWEYIDGRNWNGAVAAEMYSGPVATALRRAYPQKRRFRLLEDNDPAGFKSKKGLAAKSEAGLDVFAIPKRSPELNVCDFALWAEVSRRMRKQESKWPRNKKESRKGYLKRLRRTALNLPTAFIVKSVGSMKRRCEALRKAKGKSIEG